MLSNEAKAVAEPRTHAAGAHSLATRCMPGAAKSARGEPRIGFVCLDSGCSARVGFVVSLSAFSSHDTEHTHRGDAQHGSSR